VQHRVAQGHEDEQRHRQSCRDPVTQTRASYHGMSGLPCPGHYYSSLFASPDSFCCADTVSERAVRQSVPVVECCVVVDRSKPTVRAST